MTTINTADNLMDTDTATRIPSGIVTLDQLMALPEPQPLGNRHRPVPHHVLAAAVLAQLRERGYTDVSPTWELSFNGMQLDATLDLFDRAKYEAQRTALVESRAATYTGINAEAVQALLPEHLKGGHGVTLEISHANNRSRALRIVAGLRTFVCNNLAVDVTGGDGGDGFRARRKHTGDSTWDERLRHLFTGAFGAFEPFGKRIEAMQNASLTDAEAKAHLYDLMAVPYPLLPVSSIVDIGAIYLAHETEDVADANRWSLHNAVTRYMGDKQFGPRRLSEVGTQVTRLLSQDLMPVEAAPENAN